MCPDFDSGVESFDTPSLCAIRCCDDGLENKTDGGLQDSFVNESTMNPWYIITSENAKNNINSKTTQNNNTNVSGQGQRQSQHQWL